MSDDENEQGVESGRSSSVSTIDVLHDSAADEFIGTQPRRHGGALPSPSALRAHEQLQQTESVAVTQPQAGGGLIRSSEQAAQPDAASRRQQATDASSVSSAVRHLFAARTRPIPSATTEMGSFTYGSRAEDTRVGARLGGVDIRSAATLPVGRTSPFVADQMFHVHVTATKRSAAESPVHGALSSISTIDGASEVGSRRQVSVRGDVRADSPNMNASSVSTVEQLRAMFPSALGTSLLSTALLQSRANSDAHTPTVGTSAQDAVLVRGQRAAPQQVYAAAARHGAPIVNDLGRENMVTPGVSMLHTTPDASSYATLRAVMHHAANRAAEYTADAAAHTPMIRAPAAARTSLVGGHSMHNESAFDAISTTSNSWASDAATGMRFRASSIESIPSTFSDLDAVTAPRVPSSAAASSVVPLPTVLSTSPTSTTAPADQRAAGQQSGAHVPAPFTAHGVARDRDASLLSTSIIHDSLSVRGSKAASRESQHFSAPPMSVTASAHGGRADAPPMATFDHIRVTNGGDRSQALGRNSSASEHGRVVAVDAPAPVLGRRPLGRTSAPTSGQQSTILPGAQVFPESNAHTALRDRQTLPIPGALDEAARHPSFSTSATDAHQPWHLTPGDAVSAETSAFLTGMNSMAVSAADTLSAGFDAALESLRAVATRAELLAHHTPRSTVNESHNSSVRALPTWNQPHNSQAPAPWAGYVPPASSGFDARPASAERTVRGAMAFEQRVPAYAHGQDAKTPDHEEAYQRHDTWASSETLRSLPSANVPVAMPAVATSYNLSLPPPARAPALHTPALRAFGQASPVDLRAQDAQHHAGSPAVHDAPVAVTTHFSAEASAAVLQARRHIQMQLAGRSLTSFLRASESPSPDSATHAGAHTSLFPGHETSAADIAAASRAVIVTTSARNGETRDVSQTFAPAVGPPHVAPLNLAAASQHAPRDQESVSSHGPALHGHATEGAKGHHEAHLTSLRRDLTRINQALTQQRECKAQVLLQCVLSEGNRAETVGTTAGARQGSSERHEPASSGAMQLDSPQLNLLPPHGVPAQPIVPARDAAGQGAAATLEQQLHAMLTEATALRSDLQSASRSAPL